MKKKIYGTTTVGERGQVVIPAEARQDMGLEKGDKLIVVSMDNSLLGLLKIEQLDEMVANLSKRLKKLQAVAKQIDKERA